MKNKFKKKILKKCNLLIMKKNLISKLKLIIYKIKLKIFIFQLCDPIKKILLKLLNIYSFNL